MGRGSRKKKESRERRGIVSGNPKEKPKPSSKKFNKAAISLVMALISGAAPGTSLHMPNLSSMGGSYQQEVAREYPVNSYGTAYSSRFEDYRNMQRARDVDPNHYETDDQGVPFIMISEQDATSPRPTASIGGGIEIALNGDRNYFILLPGGEFYGKHSPTTEDPKNNSGTKYRLLSKEFCSS